MAHGRLTALNRDDRVGDFSQCRAMRDHNQSAPRHGRAEIRCNEFLGVPVERGGGLVQNQHARAAQEGARQSDALALPRRKSKAAFARPGLVAFGQPRDEFIEPRGPAGLFDGARSGLRKCGKAIFSVILTLKR